jgi:hypothetical protein
MVFTNIFPNGKNRPEGPRIKRRKSEPDRRLRASHLFTAPESSAIDLVNCG